MGFEICVESAEVAFDECTEWADQGYRSCDEWQRNCCDWWPCNWFCEIVTWFCNAWVWVSNFVCVAWKSVTLLVCLVWTVVEFVLAPLGVLIELIKSIPVIGRLIDLILNIVTTIVWRLVKLPDLFMSLAGMETGLTVRLCVLVVRFNGSYPLIGGSEITRINIENAFATAQTTWRDAATIHLALDHLTFIQEDAPQEAAIVGCGDDIFPENMGTAGSYYQFMAARLCPLGSVGRVTGLASRINVIIVPQVVNSGGCALGPLNDYLVLPGNNMACLAHEIGHKLALAHHGNAASNNIMFANGCNGTLLEWWQRAWARNSKYASQI